MPEPANAAAVRTPNIKSAGEAAREWRASLPGELRRRSLVRGSLLLAMSGIGYVAAMAGAAWLPSFFGRTISLGLAPLMIGALFVIGHDAAHNSLTPYTWLNRLLARLALLPAWHPYTSWAYAHNTLHHGGTNLRGKHPDFVPLTREEYRGLPRWRGMLEKVYRSPIGPGLSYLIEFYLGYILFPKKDQRPPQRRQFEWDRLMVFGFFVAQILGMYLLARRTPGLFLPPLPYAFFDVIMPWLIWIQFMGFVSFVQHTHPRLAWYDDPEEWSFYHVQLKSTTHVVFPYPIERLLNNIMDHAAHHIDPAIPLYHLPESQRLLEESCEEHAAVIQWSPWQYLELCRVCKLYDFERHCWTDFAGNATSEVGLPKLAFKDSALQVRRLPVRERAFCDHLRGCWREFCRSTEWPMGCDSSGVGDWLVVLRTMEGFSSGRPGWILMADWGTMISTRNQIPGRVKSIVSDKVVSEVLVETAAGVIASVITTASVKAMKLKKGDEVSVLVKATEAGIQKAD